MENQLSDSMIDTLIAEKQEGINKATELTDDEIDKQIQFKIAEQQRSEEEVDYGTPEEQWKKALPTEWLRERVDAPTYRRGERSLIGNIFERPTAAIRSALMETEKTPEERGGKWAVPAAIDAGVEAWKYPEENNKSFQQEELNKWYEFSDSIRPDWVEDNAYLRDLYNKAQSTIGAAVSIKGFSEDLMTNPAELVMTMSGAKTFKSPDAARAIRGMGTAGEKITSAIMRPIQTVKAPWRAAMQTGRRLKADYITQQLAPKAFKIYNQNIRNFNIGVQNIARKMGMAKDAIKHVKQAGYDKITRAKESIGNIENIYNKVKVGLNNKISQADDLYKGVVNKAPNKPYNVNKTYNTLKKVLTDELQVLDKRGNFMPKRLEMLERSNPRARELVAIYEDMTESLVGAGRVKPTGGITKGDFAQYRRILNKDYNSPYNQKVLQSLHNDMELGGMKGLKPAKDAYKQARVFEKRFINSQQDTLKGVATEGKLKRYFNLSSEEKKALSDIQKYTKVDFVDDLKNFDAGEQLLKLDKLNIETFQNTLQEAYNGAKRKMVIDKLRPILGDKESNYLLSEINKHSFTRKAVLPLVGIGAVTGGARYLGSKLQKATGLDEVIGESSSKEGEY